MSENKLVEASDSQVNQELEKYKDDIQFIKGKLEAFTPLTEEKINKIVDKKMLNMGTRNIEKQEKDPFDTFKEAMDLHIQSKRK